ncbi:DUF4349 domain-containing protein [Chitinophaga horti]|uniref:DUF4349 domain-containing protein n=1 Tax=Chitinophaga horti TaxID=2920382 RepID=A0ABY6J4G3_9BACT|nr:DUF4349 domain-containing protein [Chitinophaga horti]UYQ94563.1 DUF4349 domain-containing protein [Chitinophaga horti]
MRRTLYYWAIVPTWLLIACNAAPHRAGNFEGAADTTSVNQPADILSLKSPERKRMRTADFRCRVQDIHQTSERVEKLVRSLDGVVEESTQLNEYTASNDVRYSTDSLKRVQLYTATSTLKVRVPVKHLDSVIYTLSSLAEFMDYRTLADTDASLAYISNNLRNADVAQIGPTKNDKAIDMNQVNRDEKDRQIDRMIANMQIDENVAYATITVALFQPERADVIMMADPATLTEAPLMQTFLYKLLAGWKLLMVLLLGLVGLWPVWLMMAVGYWVYYRIIHRKTA